MGKYLGWPFSKRSLTGPTVVVVVSVVSKKLKSPRSPKPDVNHSVVVVGVSLDRSKIPKSDKIGWN